MAGYALQAEAERSAVLCSWLRPLCCTSLAAGVQKQLQLDVYNWTAACALPAQHHCDKTAEAASVAAFYSGRAFQKARH
jgi:hypothetical protein